MLEAENHSNYFKRFLGLLNGKWWVGFRRLPNT